MCNGWVLGGKAFKVGRIEETDRETNRIRIIFH